LGLCTCFDELEKGRVGCGAQSVKGRSGLQCPTEVFDCDLPLFFHRLELPSGFISGRRFGIQLETKWNGDTLPSSAVYFPVISPSVTSSRPLLPPAQELQTKDFRVTLVDAGRAPFESMSRGLGDRRCRLYSLFANAHNSLLKTFKAGMHHSHPPLQVDGALEIEPGMLGSRHPMSQEASADLWCNTRSSYLGHETNSEMSPGEHSVCFGRREG
jgi:hypothetical protein